jgi:hypothetical protein
VIDPKIKSNIKVGMDVIISGSGKSNDERTFRGKVVDVLDYEEYNESGILVKIDVGRIGHVVTILDKIESESTSINKIIMGEEGQNMELKSSLYYDHNLSTKEKSIRNEELAIDLVEEVASIMNSKESASLFIGVQEITDGNNIIHGIKKDIQFLSIGQSDSDKFKLGVKAALKKYIKNPAFWDSFEPKIHKINDNEICELIISPSSVPIFVEIEKKIKVKKTDLVTMDVKWHDQKIIEHKCYVRHDAEKIPYTIPDFYTYWIENKTSNKKND